MRDQRVFRSPQPGDETSIPSRETTLEPYRHNYTDGVSVTYHEQCTDRDRLDGVDAPARNHISSGVRTTFVLLRAVKSQGSLGFPNFYYARTRPCQISTTLVAGDARFSIENRTIELPLERCSCKIIFFRPFLPSSLCILRANGETNVFCFFFKNIDDAILFSMLVGFGVFYIV